MNGSKKVTNRIADKDACLPACSPVDGNKHWRNRQHEKRNQQRQRQFGSSEL